MMRIIIVAIVLVLVLVSALACSPAGRESTEETTAETGGKTSQTQTGKTTQESTIRTTPESTTRTSRASSSTAASETLSKLKVAQPGSMSDYSRERFRHWSKASEFGWDPPQASCDAREAALVRDGDNVEVGSGCKVTS